ncbi:MAG: glycosyltransferase family 39 protein [Candidatus Pacearchaeota archaeon]
MSIKKYFPKRKIIFKKYKWCLLLFLIFLLHFFLRFYQLETKSLFGWDQVDNAWVAKNIIIDHKIPLIGAPIKGNSGFNLGPIYYYLIVPFYWMFDLDPIASGIFAAVTSLLTFITLYWVLSSLFSKKVALFAVFLRTVSFAVIHSDKIQWNVNFIEPVSLVVFYALYKIITGNSRYFLLLSIAVGFSMHVDFTSVFYPLIIIFSLPFIPRNLWTLKHIVLSVPLFFIFITPTLLIQPQIKNSQVSNLQIYLQTYYHGIHLRRILQLISDAFIQFEGILYFIFLKPLKYVLLSLFILLYNGKQFYREKILLSYLFLLWFLVPWIVFSTYKGEISDYYFLINRWIVIAIIAFLLNFLFEQKHVLIRGFVLLTLGIYTYFNLINFFLYRTDGGLKLIRENVKKAIKEGRVINFRQGDPESYIYYVYTRKKFQKDIKK